MFNLNRRQIITAGLTIGLIFAGIVFSLPVMAEEQMQVPSPEGNCARCHEASKHQVNNCNTCHDLAYAEPAAYPPGGHGGLNVSDGSKLISTAPVGNCQVCHMYTVGGWDMCGNCHPSEWGDMIPPAQLVLNPDALWRAGYSHDAGRINNYVGTDTTYNCEKCHVQNWWPQIPQHNPAVFGSVYSHQDKIDSKCTGCHVDSLTTEHANRQDQVRQQMTCFTCHENSSSNIEKAVSNHRTGCAECHAAVHNIKAEPGTPAELLYPGLRWTSPMEMSIWQGESWVENYVYGFRTVVSSRSQLSAENVWAFYREGLTARGWTLQSPEPAEGAESFKIVFARGDSKIMVWFYGSEERQGSGILPEGQRIEVIYNF